MRAKIKNIIYLFLAAAVVCLASIITEAHAAGTEVSSEISTCQFAEQPVRCALGETSLEVEPLNFTTVGQHFDAAIKFTNNTNKEMSVVDESDSFVHANFKREIFTEEDFNGKLAPGASTTITIRLSYVSATTEALQLDSLGFNITFTPIETTTAVENESEDTITIAEATSEEQPESLPETKTKTKTETETNPNTADTVIPFAIFSGSSLILAFIFRKKALGKVCAVTFIASTAAIPHMTATALDKIAFNITFTGLDNQSLAIYINHEEEKVEEVEPEIDAEAPTSEEDQSEEMPAEAPKTDETEPEKSEEEPTKQAEEPQSEAPSEEAQPTREIETQPTEEQQSAQEPEAQPTEEQQLAQEPETQPAEEQPTQEPEAQPSEDQPAEEPKAEEEPQPATIENSITETEPAKTEIKTEEPVQEQTLVKGGYKYANECPGASSYDDWGMTKCQCVSYGANRVYNKHGKFPNWRGRGNAYEWPENARQEGFLVSSTPKPGVIGVQPRGQYSSYGHVVWVEKVEGDRVFISEYNWSGSRDYNERWTDASNFQYIYFYEYE